MFEKLSKNSLPFADIGNIWRRRCFVLKLTKPAAAAAAAVDTIARPLEWRIATSSAKHAVIAHAIKASPFCQCLTRIR